MGNCFALAVTRRDHSPSRILPQSNYEFSFNRQDWRRDFNRVGRALLKEIVKTRSWSNRSCKIMPSTFAFKKSCKACGRGLRCAELAHRTSSRLLKEIAAANATPFEAWSLRTRNACHGLARKVRSASS